MKRIIAAAIFALLAVTTPARAAYVYVDNPGEAPADIESK
jgi:hypothetical protein